MSLWTNVNLLPGLSGLPDYQRGQRLLMAAAFELYADDSGSEPQSQIFFLAGFISTVDRWAAFSNEWDAALALPPALEYFKMAEAMSFQGQFSMHRGWNEAMRNDRLVLLTRIVNRHAMLRVSASIRHDLFERYVLSLPAVERNLSTDEPYVTLGSALVSAALTHADQNGVNTTMDFIFDRQIGHELEFRRLWPSYTKLMLETPRGRQLSRLVGEPMFLDEKDRKPLQAADLYAWLARDHYAQNHRFPNQKIVVPMSPYLRQFRGIPSYHNPLKEDFLARQREYVRKVGEQIKLSNPDLVLTPAAPTRRERKSARKRAKSAKSKKASAI